MERRGGEEQETDDASKRLIVKGTPLWASLLFSFLILSKSKLESSAFEFATTVNIMHFECNSRCSGAVAVGAAEATFDAEQSYPGRAICGH